MADKIQFRPGLLAAPLAARADATNPENLSIDLVAKRDLQRYYQVLEDSMPTLTQGEAGWIVDILNSTVLEEATYRYLWVEVQDSIEDGMDEKWSVDGKAFARKVKTLPPGAVMALVDAAERFWRAGAGKDMKADLEAAGFRVE